MRHTSLLFGLSLLIAAGCAEPGSLEPVYQGCASDENWRTFDDYISTSRVKSDAANAPKWLSPQSGATLLTSQPVTLSWQPTATDSGSVNGNATCPQFQPASLALRSPNRVERAAALQPRHQPPVSGTVYDLHISVGGSDMYRILTTRQAATLSEMQLKDWAGKQITVTLYSAQLLKNEVAQGPFQAPSLELSVAP